MANRYMDERKYLQNGSKYDCQQASRGYRQSQDTSRLTGKQRTSQKSSGVTPPPHHGKEHESNQENEKQCEYLKYPLPQPRAPPRGKPSAAANSHQCQVMVNTPRYYKPKPHRHPSALSIPLLSRPESEINLKARSRSKMTDVTSVKDKRRRVKQRTVAANKHEMNEATQKQRGMQPTDASSASDEDDLRSVSLRAYSSGCLSVDISSQVGDLVKAFNTVSKRHKVKKIVYEEIEPIYPKCELQQLKPQRKNSQKIINDRRLQKSEPNYDFNPGLTEVPETEEEYESKCTCNEQENLMKTTIDQGIGDKKDVDQLEKLFLEVFAQGKVEGLPKQKKLDCLQDAYNQYSAALEDFSNNQEIDSDGCILSQHQSQQNYSNQTQYVSSGNCEGGTGHQLNVENNLRARRRYRNTRQVEQIPNESIDGDEQEAIDETNQEVMQCTCNHGNDRSNDNQFTTDEHNANVDYTNFPYSQTDFSEMLTNQRQNKFLEKTDERSFENTINDQQDAERFDETYNCSRSNSLTQNQIDSQFRNREHTLVGGIDCRRDSSLTPDSGIARTLNSKLSTQLHENGKASTPHSSIPCPAPPKLSISDNHFRPDSRNNYCGHIQCFQRSKSKGVEIANMGKRQMTRNKSSDRDSSEAQNLTYNQETPIIQSDFPSEVPNANRSRAEVDSTIVQPRKPVNYDAEVRRAEINGSINNVCNNSVKISNSNTHNNPNNQTGNDSIGFNPFLNFLLQNDSNYNIANIVPPEEQSVYFCDVTPDLQQQYNIKQNVDEECDDRNTYTKNPSNADLFLNAQSSTKDAKWHDMNRNKAEANPMCTINGNENKLNNRTSDDYSQNTRRILDGVRESLSINSNEKRRLKASDCSFEQINKTCSDQSSYKNYIESIIDHSTEISANNGQASAPTQSQRSNCQTDWKIDTAETATDSAASQVDSKVNQEISQRLNDRLVQSEKAIPPASLVTLEEPEYLQHLKKLRWDHLRHISREVHRLENLERFLDSCGCGHMMIHKGMT